MDEETELAPVTATEPITTTDKGDTATPEEEEKGGVGGGGSKETLKPVSNNLDVDKDDVLSQSSMMSGDNDHFEDLSKWQQFRTFIRMEIVQTSWFETVILIVILINCVFLALDNPTHENDTLESVIYITEIVFTVIYIIEMILKWIALGFIGRHRVEDSAKDKTQDQKASVFSYMVNSVFNGEEEERPKDDYVGYFLDGWNVLDFFVVVIGSIIPLIVPGAASVSSIRALRILRALRTIPRVPKLRTLVMTIIDAIPGLTGSFILLSFFFIVFGIIGIQMFHGKLQNQCTTLDTNGNKIPLTYIAGDGEYIALCGYDSDDPGGKVFFGAFEPRQSCNDVAVALNLPAVYTCTKNNANPVAETQHYDNIFYALLQVFQTVTLQDWSYQLYNLARGQGYIVAVFFVPLTFLVSFFAINLILAVIVDTYSKSTAVVQTEEDYDSTLHEMDELIAQKTSKRSAPVKQQITYETYPRKLRGLREKGKTFEELFREYNQGPVERANKTHELQRKTKLRVDTARGGGKDGDAKSIHLELQAIAEEVNNESKQDIYDMDEFRDETWEFTQRADEQKKLRREMIEDMMLNFNKDLAFEVWLLAKPIKDDWLSGKPLDVTPITTSSGQVTSKVRRDKRRFWQKRKPMFIRWLHWVSTSEWFEKAIIFIILLNTIILAIHWPAINRDLAIGLQVLNYCFTILFALELVIKFLGLGPARWWFDKFNVFDAVIVLVSLVELGIPDGGAGALLAFRALRVLRVLRLLHQIPGLRVLFDSILNSFEPVVFLVLIIILFVFMFGVLGVQLFAGQIHDEARANDGFLMMTRPWRFDTLWYSMITFLQLFTADGWASVMEDTVDATGSTGTMVVIIVTVIIGLWLFRNMFLAILINRMGSQDNIQLMIDDLLILAREKQRIFDEKTAIKEFEKDVRRIRKERMGSQSASKHQQRIEAIEASKKITGKSLGCLEPSNATRLFLHKLQASDVFEWCINILILINCVFLAFNGPHVDHASELGRTLRVLDWVFTSIFFVEMCIKMTALGIYKSKDKNKTEQDEKKERERRLKKHLNHDHRYDDSDIDYGALPCTNAYLQSWWNRLDALVVLFAIIGLGFPEVGFLRGLRAIRPIRIAIRIPQVRVVVKALIASLTNVINAVCFSFFILFVLGIVGLQLFCGQFGRCVYGDSSNAFDIVLDLEPPTEWQCLEEGHSFINPGYNFDNIGVSLLTVFKISMFSNWYDELSGGMASGGYADQLPSAFAAVPYNRPFAASFFILIVLVAGFFVLNIIISVVVDSFNRIKDEDEANALLTQQQVLWVRKRRFLQRFSLRQGKKRPKIKYKFRNLMFNFVENPLFEYFIIGCILSNTIFLMTEHEGQAAYWSQVLFVFELIFVIIYCVEAIFKLIAYGVRGYFYDWWNVFDFGIVVVSIIGLFFSSGLAVVRLLRVLRVIRLVKKAPLLRALFITLGYALPSLFNIGLLLLVIFFIFGIFGVELFGKVFHSDGYGNLSLYDSNEGLSRSINFEYFGTALFILYRTATNDNWGSILLSTGAQGALACSDEILSQASPPSDGTFDYKCGNMAASVTYFVLFTIFGTFVLINLFIAVILDTYVDNVQFEQKLLKLQLVNPWKQKWLAAEKEIYGKKLKPRLPIKMFVKTLKSSPILIGFLLDSLNLRLNIEDTDAEIDYEDVEELTRRSTETYGKLDFVGKPNIADKKVIVSNDHLNAVFKTRRLRILCSYRGSELDEKLVVTYSDALFAICSLLVGPEFRLLPYDNNKQVHISDWWAERLEEMMMRNE